MKLHCYKFYLCMIGYRISTMHPKEWYISVTLAVLLKTYVKTVKKIKRYRRQRLKIFNVVANSA
jgi:hypothetical protein